MAAATTIERLNRWKQAGIITDGQHGLLAALLRKQRFSLFLELSALLYIGVVSLATGIGWTVHTYFTNLGDVFVLTALSALLAGTLYYCFSRGVPYAHEEVESPNLAFDYILYLACLTLSVELGYIELRFGIFHGAWANDLLLATVVLLPLAYRFDNRFVLSVGLASLAGWFGLKVSGVAFMTPGALRFSAIVYGVIVSAAGAWLHRLGIKRHFLETYLHVAGNTIFAALVSGIGDAQGLLYLGALLLLSSAAVVLGIRFARFAFVAYGIVYGYVGISYKVLDGVNDATTGLGYLVVSGTLVIVALVMLARRFGRDE